MTDTSADSLPHPPRLPPRCRGPVRICGARRGAACNAIESAVWGEASTTTRGGSSLVEPPRLTERPSSLDAGADAIFSDDVFESEPVTSYSVGYLGARLSGIKNAAKDRKDEAQVEGPLVV